MLSDNNAYFWYTSSSTQGWWRRSRWKSKQMFKRWFKRDTIMPRDNVTLWSETTFKGQCLIWTCKRFRSTRTLSEAYYQEEETEADHCVSIVSIMQTLSIERTRVRLQLSTENATFKSSEIALLKQLEMRWSVRQWKILFQTSISSKEGDWLSNNEIESMNDLQRMWYQCWSTLREAILSYVC